MLRRSGCAIHSQPGSDSAIDKPPLQAECQFPGFLVAGLSGQRGPRMNECPTVEHTEEEIRAEVSGYSQVETIGSHVQKCASRIVYFSGTVLPVESAFGSTELVGTFLSWAAAATVQCF